MTLEILDINKSLSYQLYFKQSTQKYLCNRSHSHSVTVFPRRSGMKLRTNLCSQRLNLYFAITSITHLSTQYLAEVRKCKQLKLSEVHYCSSHTENNTMTQRKRNKKYKTTTDSQLCGNVLLQRHRRLSCRFVTSVALCRTVLQTPGGNLWKFHDIGWHPRPTLHTLPLPMAT
jgi:hypothetical protein